MGRLPLPRLQGRRGRRTARESGKPLARYFPEAVAALQRADTNNFIVDGELAVPAGPTLSFQALQARIHPAKSRVMRLAAETPALLILFDCLATEDLGPILDRPLTERRSALEGVAEQLAATRGCGRRRLPMIARRPNDGW
jgi:ATP-dependent DNA ligase